MEQAVHKEASWLARSLGLSFSRVVEQKLKEFIHEEEAKFSIEYPLITAGQSRLHIEKQFNAISAERAKRLQRHDPIWQKMERDRQSIMRSYMRRQI